jgi:hypothetical protein
MTKEFVTYELALKLKEIGFDEPCFGYYTSPTGLLLQQPIGGNGEFVYYAPTFSQAFRWFREKYGLFVSPNVISYEDGIYLWFFEINSTVLPFGTDLGETDDYKTYEEAELACLDKLIELVESELK